MASIKKRDNGNLSLVFWWKGKQWIKALGTTDPAEAKRIKKDAEAQLDRIRQGKSIVAAKLLADGFSILDVLFGSPEVALRIGKESQATKPPLGPNQGWLLDSCCHGLQVLARSGCESRFAGLQRPPVTPLPYL